MEATQLPGGIMDQHYDHATGEDMTMKHLADEGARAARVLVVSVEGWLDEAHLAELQAAAEVEVVITETVDEDELARLVEGFDYLMVDYDVIGCFSPAFYEYESVRRLRAISCDVTGMDWASPSAAAAVGVPLLQVPGYSTRSVAESCVTEALLHAHNRHLAYQDVAQGITPLPRLGRNLSSSTVGIIGLGDIGRCCAELFSALGSEVLSWSLHEHEGYSQVSLTELFERCDVLVVAMKTVTSGAGRNVGIIGAELLAKCERTIVVNLARPELVDNDAMKEAIRSGRVVGYSIDAPTGDEELEAMSAVHLSPHDAWYTEESMEGLRRVWVGNVLAHLEGRLENAYSE